MGQKFIRKSVLDSLAQLRRLGCIIRQVTALPFRFSVYDKTIGPTIEHGCGQSDLRSYIGPPGTGVSEYLQPRSMRGIHKAGGELSAAGGKLSPSITCFN